MEPHVGIEFTLKKKKKRRAFGSGHDPRVLGSSPMIVFLLGGGPASRSPSASPPTDALSLK